VFETNDSATVGLDLDASVVKPAVAGANDVILLLRGGRLGYSDCEE
jgi:hypothetical protein